MATRTALATGYLHVAAGTVNTTVCATLPVSGDTFAVPSGVTVFIEKALPATGALAALASSSGYGSICLLPGGSLKIGTTGGVQINRAKEVTRTTYATVLGTEFVKTGT